MTDPNFVDDLRRKIASPDGKDMDALSTELGGQVVELVRANFAKLMARDIMGLPDDGGLGYACVSAAFTCGNYSCTGVVSCSGAFSCTLQFAG
jgi:hypothetical protein